MPNLLTRIVGFHFRPYGKALLSIMSEGQALHLDPEPDNPYDPDAVAVLVDIRRLDVPINAETEAVIAELHESAVDWESHPFVHIGYVPKSRTKTDTLRCGNLEVLERIGADMFWKASLTFGPAGDPCVRVEDI